MSTRNRTIDPRYARTRARILKHLESGAATRAELAKHLSISIASVRNCINRLTAAPRQVHVCDWIRTRGHASAKYALGDMPDAVFSPQRVEPKPRVNMIEVSCKVIVDALATPKSVIELAELLHCSVMYVRKYIAILMAETTRRIYVKAWRRPDGPGGLTKVYVAGNRRDAERPRWTSAERFQELKADPEKHERALKLRRLSAARRRTRKKPQNVFSALGL